MLDNRPTNPIWSRQIRQPLPLTLLRGDHPSKKGEIKSITNPNDERSTTAEKAILCRRCMHTITSSTERKEVNGSHLHTFANPDGIVFEIGCYGNAWGCRFVGPASTEFTWFKGCLWRIAVCSHCLAHLGWHFSSSGDYFFHGLITDRLLID